MTSGLTHPFNSLVVVVPAAGAGKRMRANRPKQYLKINELSVLEHTVLHLLEHEAIVKVIVVISQEDEYFCQTSLHNNPDILTVKGGQERVDSVLSGLKAIDEVQFSWVMVHDAARPCVSHQDIDALIASCQSNNQGGLLAYPVKDTMKRGNQSSNNRVDCTVERNDLWHALTPQMYPVSQLIQAIEQSKSDAANITDESSAIEHVGLPSLLVEGSSENIKITRPEDLALATFYLAQHNAT